jgi:hypothetical protein
MAIPAFLAPLTALNLAAVSALGGAATPGSKKLNLSVQTQQQTNWCWAAVSTSVSHFYNAGSAWTQCLVANSALPRNDCCGAGASDPAKCDKPWYLDTALQTTGNLASVITRALSFAEIQTEIGKDAPIGSRVGWYGGGGHFQTVVGWLVGEGGTEYIDISDPIYLDAQIEYADFASSYQTGGDWTHSYLTRAPAAAGGKARDSAAQMSLLRTAYPESIGA